MTTTPNMLILTKTILKYKKVRTTKMIHLKSWYKESSRIIVKIKQLSQVNEVSGLGHTTKGATFSKNVIHIQNCEISFFNAPLLLMQWKCVDMWNFYVETSKNKGVAEGLKLGLCCLMSLTEDFKIYASIYFNKKKIHDSW